MNSRREFYFSKRKPLKCPKCGSKSIAKILLGLPAYSKELVDDLYSGKIVLGGCCVSKSDPTWACTECNTYIYKERLKGIVENEEA